MRGARGMYINEMGWDKDHPRRCGEHVAYGREFKCRMGSSPQMRGARVPASFRASLMRIIPADAGSTTVAEAVTAKGRDHPRRCGEHESMGAGRFAKTGSSPQMRGALKIETGRYRFSGSSPQMRGALNSFCGIVL